MPVSSSLEAIRQHDCVRAKSFSGCRRSTCQPDYLRYLPLFSPAPKFTKAWMKPSETNKPKCVEPDGIPPRFVSHSALEFRKEKKNHLFS